MQVDSSLELGRDDPALEFPWASDDGRIRYHDLKNNAPLIEQLPEARDFCELREFLLRVNAPEFALQTAKSDIWMSDEISPEEEVFGARQKLVSYVDLIFAAPAPRLSLESHLELVSKLCALLQRAPEMPATVEFIVRHCYYHPENPEPGETAGASEHERFSGGPLSPQDQRTADPFGTSHVGFCVTGYVSGFADTEAGARQRWAIALKLLQHALVQALRA